DSVLNPFFEQRKIDVVKKERDSQTDPGSPRLLVTSTLPRGSRSPVRGHPAGHHSALLPGSRFLVLLGTARGLHCAPASCTGSPQRKKRPSGASTITALNDAGSQTNRVTWSDSWM